MKKPLLINLLVILGLSVSSCQLLPFGTETEPTDEGSEPTPAAEQESESEATATETEEENQAELVEEEEIVAPNRRVSGLKKATNPDQFVQARGVAPGENRSDPFTLFPIAPDGTIQPPQVDSEPPEPTGGTDSLPNLPEQDATPPPPPQPEIARAVQVQGAVKIGNQVTAIVRAPNESTSRYVRPGQRIANNQVIVKRINIDQRPTPTVVLEEIGIDQEVIKNVEEGMTTAATTDANSLEGGALGQLPPPPPPSI